MDYWGKKLIICLLLLDIKSIQAKEIQSWTWTYKKIFSEQQRIQNKKKNTLIFEKNNIPAFSQLIFSWNGFKPTKGYFIFSVQSKNVGSKKWSKWHKMFSWGVDIQRSHFNTCDLVRYIYVRLETGKYNKADTFRIKIVAQEGASLDFLKGFTINISDFTKFKNESSGKTLVTLPSVFIRHVPKISQRILDHPKPLELCSPTSCSMLAGFFNKKKIDPVQFAYGVFDTGLNTYGSWPFNMAQLFETCDGKFLCYTTRMNSFLQLHHKLALGIPVAVSVRGGITGAPKSYTAGHLLVVLGWDAKRKKVVCHDPAFFSDKGTFIKYDIDSFLRAWERSHRLAYVSEPLAWK